MGDKDHEKQRELVKRELKQDGAWGDAGTTWERIKSGLKRKGEAGIAKEFKKAVFAACGFNQSAGKLKGVKGFFDGKRKLGEWGSFSDFVSSLGIYVVGVGSSNSEGRESYKGKIVYAMKITDVMPFDEYSNSFCKGHDESEGGYPDKTPAENYFIEGKKSDEYGPLACGDNIYEVDSDNTCVRVLPSFHYFPGTNPLPQMCKDLGGQYVLISAQGYFSYFGKNAIEWKLDELYGSVGHKVYRRRADEREENKKKDIFNDDMKDEIERIISGEGPEFEELKASSRFPDVYGAPILSRGKLEDGTWWDQDK